ncbi:MAG: hypothetical protein L0Z62_42600, partial [Gemmataceae bacterium]|nr:hypothetical protein [Gemmataceae bacterium]
VVWVLTGRVVTDCDDEAAQIPLYSPPKPNGRSWKLRDWPVVHTLPLRSDPLSHNADCWAELMLRSEDGTRTLHLRRTLHGDLKEGDDGVVWRLCQSSATHGITPLDLQLSVSAATVFGRRSLEAASDTRHLLSMMLGYDALEQLGDLVTTLAGNLTKAAKAEREAVVARRERLRAKLAALPTRLREGLALREIVGSLVGEELPSVERITEVSKQVESAVRDAEFELAGLLGLRTEGATPPPGLVNALNSAVATLVKPLEELFPTMMALRPPAAPAVPGGAADAAPLAALAKALRLFEYKARATVKDRLAWWRKESLPNSKASLLIQAAMYFDPDNHRCPVCETDVAGLPVEAELRDLKGAAAELRAGLRQFFRDLADEIDATVPAPVRGLGAKQPAQRLQEDWLRLRREIGSVLTPVVDQYNATLLALLSRLPSIAVPEPDLVPADADQEFRCAASALLNSLHAAKCDLASLAWAAAHLPEVVEGLYSSLIAPEGDGPPSLLAVLGRGKHAAADWAPLAAVHDSFVEAAAEASGIRDAAAAVDMLEEVRITLEEIKPLGKYAVAEVERVFEQIKDKTIENCRKLYPHAHLDLAPSRLHLNKGRDKTVEAYLACDHFEVPGQHFANAGMSRAVALAFFFALLERHPGGLGFVLMDDPILSLDDDHREAWSANVLRPTLATTQIIVTTHQRQFLVHCRADFQPGRIVELNPRTRSRRITYRTANRLDWAEEMLTIAWNSVPTEMRKYREELLFTLDSYSPTPFFSQGNLTNSLDCYAKLQPPHPLAGNGRDIIVRRLRDPKVTHVLDPGSHALTEANLTEPMVRDCLRELRELDKTFRNELDRLEALRLRELRSKSTSTAATGLAIVPIDTIRVGDEVASWSEPVQLSVIGTAAAQTHGCVVDLSEPSWDATFPPGGAVRVIGKRRR